MGTRSRSTTATHRGAEAGRSVGFEAAHRAALAFNDAITRRDLASLGRLMTDDHAFIDAGDNVWSGKEEVLNAWRGFFEAFPDYRNVWSSVSPGDGVLIAVGRSVSASEPQLDGPAIWTVKTLGERVSEWRIYEDTLANRTRLGVEPPSD
jgi:ketosteroid isomerase-like protein